MIHSSFRQNCRIVVVHAPAEVHIVMIDVAAVVVVVHDVVGLVANYLPARVMARSCFHQILHHVTKVLVVRGVSGAAAVLNEHYQLTQVMCGYIENACVADKWTPAPNLAQAVISHLNQKQKLAIIS